MKLSKYATGPVQCGSIHEIYRRLQEEGYRIGESALRAWVKEGLIPSIRCGLYHQRLQTHPASSLIIPFFARTYAII